MTKLLYLFTTIFILPFSAWAGALTNPIQVNTIPEALLKIIDLIKIVAQPLAVIAFLYGGFLYLTSAGSPEKVKQATLVMTWALVGMAIILVGVGFIRIICGALGINEALCPGYIM